MADLLRLLQPVESSWKTLARYLLKNEQRHKIATIESDCFHKDDVKKALDEVLDKWLQCTVGSKRKWQTLCDAAKEYDDSLEKYIEENKLDSEFYNYGLPYLDVMLSCREKRTNNEGPSEVVQKLETSC